MLAIYLFIYIFFTRTVAAKEDFVIVLNIMAHTQEEAGHPESGECCMKVGPWGCSHGNEWSYKANKGGISQIVILHGWAVDSILFICDDGNGGFDYSSKFGGNGGNTSKIDIDWPKEFLTSISGTFDYCWPFGPKVIKSLRFYTNVTKYGPYGFETGNSFSFPMEGVEIVGFHGRSLDFVNSIGVYVKRVFTACRSTQEFVAKTQEKRTMEVVEPRMPGPWGGPGGKPWDDGVFSAVRQVHVLSKNGMVHAIQFQYVKRNGKTVWSQKHGGSCEGCVLYRINLDSMSEFLMGVSGFNSQIIKGDNGLDVLRSITFYSNKGKYGPFGEEIGTSFTSPISSGKVVGFLGRSGAYLNAIGVHLKYF